MMIEKWGLIIAWDIPNDCYIASVPELLACTGVGRTRREALDALEQEVDHWLRTSRELGDTSPVHETQEVEALPTEKPQPVKPIAAEPQDGVPHSSHAATLSKGRFELSESHTVTGLTISIARNLPVIFLAGEGDIGNCHLLRQSCDNIFASGIRAVVIDMTELVYIDSSILGVMINAVKKFRSVDGFVCLVNSSEANVNHLFQITRLNSILWMCSTLDEAIEKLHTLRVLPNQEQTVHDLP
ncbi:MAG: anti-sigma factor antagonist [Armatimonadota bacterium]|nr:anti-sigma factor antagonist [Armatimonadota bacterium]